MPRVLLAALLVAGPALAQPVATLDTADASVIRRPAGKPAFEPVPKGGAIAPGDLLVALPGAVVRAADGAVIVTSRADPDGSSPLPVFESAYAMRPAEGVDLDLTLDRGRVDLANAKPAGAAAVRVRFHKQTWAVTLDGPGTKVAVEVISRWPAGSVFVKTPTDGHEPDAAAVLAVLAGSASVSDGKTTLALTAPPGPALVDWASTGRGPLAARRLDALPEWADPNTEKPSGQRARAVAERFRLAVVGGTIEAAIDTFLKSADPAERRVGLIAAGATDDLPRLTAAIAAATDRDVWDFGVSVGRHWVGRSAGQERALYEFLTAARKYTPNQAEVVLDLLHGFTDEERNRPETYEVLTGYLLSDRPAVRSLAAWHLARLAPAGKDLPFRPNGSKEEFEGLYKQWRALVPPGKLPPAK